MFEEQAGNSGEEGLWESVASEARGPIDIIYVAEEEVDLADIEEWGLITGMWTIRLVESVDHAIRENQSEPADLMILLGTSIAGAERIARAFPALPMSLVRHGGWDEFPKGWPCRSFLRSGRRLARESFRTPSNTLSGRWLRRLCTPLPHRASKCFLRCRRNCSIGWPNTRKSVFFSMPVFSRRRSLEILSRMGYDVRLTPRRGDMGVTSSRCYAPPRRRSLCWLNVSGMERSDLSVPNLWPVCGIGCSTTTPTWRWL